MIEPKQKAIELVKKMINKVYCYMGSGMLTNTYDDGVALHNAKECALVVAEALADVSNDFFMTGGTELSSYEKLYIMRLHAEIRAVTIEDVFPPKTELK